MKKDILKFASVLIAFAITLTASGVFAAKMHPTDQNILSEAKTHTSSHSEKKSGTSFRGTITGISDTILTVTYGKSKTVTVTVDASQAKIRIDNTLKSISDLKVNDNIIVIGSSKDSTVLATTITVRPSSSHTPKMFTGFKFNKNELKTSKK